MPLAIGATPITGAYLGATALAKVYRGADPVFDPVIGPVRPSLSHIVGLPYSSAVAVGGTGTFAFTAATGDLLVAWAGRITTAEGVPPTAKWAGADMTRVSHAITAATGSVAACLFMVKGGKVGSDNMAVVAATGINRQAVIAYDVYGWDGTLGTQPTPVLENTSDATIPITFSAIEADALAFAMAAFNTELAAPLDANTFDDLHGHQIASNFAMATASRATTAAEGSTVCTFTGATSVNRKAAVGVVLMNTVPL